MRHDDRLVHLFSLYETVVGHTVIHSLYELANELRRKDIFIIFNSLRISYVKFFKGKTSVLHDSESPTDVGHCADPGCYSRPIKYSASTRQMDALSELSNECHQSIRVNFRIPMK